MKSVATLSFFFKEENIMQKRNRTFASIVCLILVAAMIVTSFVGLGVM